MYFTVCLFTSISFRSISQAGTRTGEMFNLNLHVRFWIVQQRVKKFLHDAVNMSVCCNAAYFEFI